MYRRGAACGWGKVAVPETSFIVRKRSCLIHRITHFTSALSAAFVARLKRSVGANFFVTVKDAAGPSRFSTFRAWRGRWVDDCRA